MAQKRCCIPGCTSSNSTGAILHNFPNPSTASEKFHTWVVNAGLIGEDDNYTFRNRRICRLHFEEIYYYPKNRLSKLAVPTLRLTDGNSKQDAISEDDDQPLKNFATQHVEETDGMIEINVPLVHSVKSMTEDEEESPSLLVERHSKAAETEVEEVVIKCEVIEISDEEAEEQEEKGEKKKRKKKRSVPKERSKCEHCPKTFATRYELKKHVRTHTGERPYMCPICGKTYTQLGHLSIHQLSHQGIKNFNCNECGASFYRKADLDRHERIHLGIKPHVCEICSKSFTQKNNLVMHVKTHIGDRAHLCTVCNKRFITRSKLVLHSKRHEKSKKNRNDLGLGDDEVD